MPRHDSLAASYLTCWLQGLLHFVWFLTYLHILFYFILFFGGGEQMKRNFIAGQSIFSKPREKEKDLIIILLEGSHQSIDQYRQPFFYLASWILHDWKGREGHFTRHFLSSTRANFELTNGEEKTIFLIKMVGLVLFLGNGIYPCVSKKKNGQSLFSQQGRRIGKLVHLFDQYKSRGCWR